MTKKAATDHPMSDQMELLEKYTLLGYYQAQMTELLSAAAPTDRPDRSESDPFLTVIMRTQGKRYEMLKEALLCLEAQSDADFEVVLIVHNGDDAGKASVDQLLDTLSPEFRAKIRREHLDGGTRTSPLNLGASLARGTHFAMLDDDDILFDNWVENFHTAAMEHPNTVIRCYGCTQIWKAVETHKGLQLRSEGSIRNQYCTPFNLISHLQDNQTPISCVAIPTICHQVLGITFDETLTTAEDWDYIMRCILTVGVRDTEKITFLYRLWHNVESSRTMHAQKEWRKNRNNIYKKLDRIPIVTDRQTLLQMDQRAQDVSIAVSASPLNSMIHYMAPYSIKMTCKQILQAVKSFLRCRLRLKKHVALLKASKYFDEEWYLETYPDVSTSNLSPVKHYLIYGWHELRDPSPDFCTKRYLELYPDVVEARICPLLHYEQSGKNEQREI